MVLTLSVHLSFGIFFKPILSEFGWTRAETSAAVSFSWIVASLAAIGTGALNDRFGPRIAISLCGLFLGAGCLLTSQISSIWQLYLFYGVMVGIGISVSIPIMSTVARWFVRRRSLMTGIVVSGAGVAGLIGPPIANWLISSYGWRLSYMILGSIVMVLIIFAAQFLRRDPVQVGQEVYGGNTGSELELDSGAAAFSLSEAIRSRQLWLAFAMFFCTGFCLHVIQVHLVPHATDIGISATAAAGILATMGGANMAGRIVLGSVGDRIGNRPAYIIGFVLIIVALFWLVPSTDALRFYLFAVIFGMACGNCVTQQSPLVAMLFGVRSHGLILGVIGSGHTLGAAAGPFMAGYMFDITGNYQLAFLLNAGIGIIGLVVTILLTTKVTRPAR